MRDLSCLNTVITDNLAAHIDLSNIKSWDLNADFTSISLTKWAKAYSGNEFLYDFGLTAFDNGRVSGITDSLQLTPNDTKLKLYRVGYNTETGGTFYDGFEIQSVTGTNVGNYFITSGGYLQGFFGLKDYKFQTLPYRYEKGVTLETLVYVMPESYNDGYFLFIGARSEDKYIPYFSGETTQYTATTTSTTYGSRGSYLLTQSEVKYSGVTTSEDNFLNSTSNIVKVKKAINDENHTEEIEIENLNGDINNNVIGFYLSSSYKLGYTKIDSNGVVQNDESGTLFTKTGWTIISMSFKPYDIIYDKDLLSCAPIRKGDFIVYVNGRLFWKISDFEEFYFRGFKNAKEKQLGVPYTLSWGGGSYGLKHSFHWDLNERIIFNKDNVTGVTNSFQFVNDPSVTYDCPPEPVSGYTQYVSISANTTTFNIVDPCDLSNFTPNSVLEWVESGGTGTTTSEYFGLYNVNLSLISNRDYTFTVKVYENGIFNPYSTGEIGMFFIGNVSVEKIYSKPYTKDVNTSGQWNDIVYKIKLKENSSKQNIKAGLYISSSAPLNNEFKVYFDEFKFIGSDKLKQDNRKNELLIEETYSKSFVGGIQKLRVYDNALNSREILHNAIIEARNGGYNLKVLTGGRLINGNVSSNSSTPLTPIIPIPQHNIQLRADGAGNINMIIPVTITWNHVDYYDIIYFLFVGDSKIHFKQTGNYKISYGVTCENNDANSKVIGFGIRVNGTTILAPYTTQATLDNIIGATGSANISDYETIFNTNDYIELICFRSGLNGVVTIVPGQGWINVEKV
jgi:hypothetical protein